jgi:hypothetical protein
MKLKDPHSQAFNTCLKTLETSVGGLTAAEAARRLEVHGRNQLPEARRRGPVRRFLTQFHNVLIYVLLGAALVTASLQHWVDTGVILAVVLANAVIGFLQEGKAEAAMAAIRDMLAPHAAVLRDGARVTVSGTELVPGDIVLLEAGDKVPADLRLIEAQGLAAQEAMLTGESVPVEKATNPVAEDAALGDRSSMLWSGTLVTQGTAKGLVVATGASTEVGRIGGLLEGVEQLTTPLVAQMDYFARWLSFLILLISALLLLYGYFVGHRDFAELFMVVIGVAVAAIPEGLPAVMTITLAIGVQAMAQRRGHRLRFRDLHRQDGHPDTQRDDRGRRRDTRRCVRDFRRRLCPGGRSDPGGRAYAAGPRREPLQRRGTCPARRSVDGGRRSDGRGTACLRRQDPHRKPPGHAPAGRHPLRLPPPLHGGPQRGGRGQHHLREGGA